MPNFRRRRARRNIGLVGGGVRRASLAASYPQRLRITSMVCRADSGDSSGSKSSSPATAVPATPLSGGQSSLGTSLTQLGAGAIAGLVNTLVLSPLDVAKTRMQVGTSNRAYTGTIHALRTMLKEEGIVSWYRGLSAALWAFVPNCRFVLKSSTLLEY